MNSNKIEKHLLYLFFAVLALLQIYFLLYNEKTYGGADNVTHFQIARYAFEYPQLFLDLWGKPVYSTLLAPFTLGGYKFAQVFNLLIALITLLFVFKLSRVLYPSGALFTVILTAFAPVYFLLMLSCLTETLFSLVLILAVYFFAKNKFIVSAIILSFIPFVRSEGYILFPIFALAFLFKRSWFSIIFLATGTIFYSVIGYFVFGDFLWIANRFPYQIDNSIYGSGELFHFVKNSNFIFGVPFLVFIVLGLFYWGWEVFRKFRLKEENTLLFLLIAGSWLAYFAAHSFVWWQGKSSLGLIRVIGGVIPLAGLTATKGIQFFFETIKNRRIVYSLLTLFAIFQIYLLTVQTHLPYKADPVDKLIDKASEYIKQNYPDTKIYYFNPEFVFHLGLDPYDPAKSVWGIGDRLQPSNTMDFGDILIWDAHFGPNEGRISYETVQNDPFLQKIKVFLPEEKITVLGGYEYEIHIYRKKEHPINDNINETLTRRLEIPKRENDLQFLEIEKGEQYSPSIVIYLNELQQKDIFDAELSIRFKSRELIAGKEVLLVFSVENGKEVLHYSAFPLEWKKDESDWKTAVFNTRFPADFPESASMKVYIWNRGQKHLLIQEMQAKVGSE